MQLGLVRLWHIGRQTHILNSCTRSHRDRQTAWGGFTNTKWERNLSVYEMAGTAEANGHIPSVCQSIERPASMRPSIVALRINTINPSVGIQSQNIRYELWVCDQHQQHTSIIDVRKVHFVAMIAYDLSKYFQAKRYNYIVNAICDQPIPVKIRWFSFISILNVTDSAIVIRWPNIIYYTNCWDNKIIEFSLILPHRNVEKFIRCNPLTTHKWMDTIFAIKYTKEILKKQENKIIIN